MPNHRMAHPREYETLAPYRAYLFGSFQLLRDGTPVEEAPRRKKAQKILKWFLLNPGRVVAADELVDLFWPHGSPDKGFGNFHVTMHCLRRMLEPDLGPRQDSAFVVRHANNFYSFDIGSVWWTDVADVDLLFSRGNQSDVDDDPQRACFYYRRINEYCRRGLLVDEWSGEEWLAPYRERYRQMHLQSLTRLMRYGRDADVWDELVDRAYEMHGLEACNEMANEIVIESLLTSGNVGAATRQLERFARLLRDELGMPLPREFRALRRRIAGEVGAPRSISSPEPERRNTMSTTVNELFDAMPEHFNERAASGLTKTLQWNITGDEPGVWAFEIVDGEGRLIPGGVEKPDLTFETSDQTWIAIAEGRQDAMKAFMLGKLKVSGDMVLAMKVQELFLAGE